VATFNIHYAKTHLSKLLEQVQAGEEIVIAKSGKPIAKLCPIPETAEKTKPKRVFDTHTILVLSPFGKLPLSTIWAGCGFP